MILLCTARNSQCISLTILLARQGCFDIGVEGLEVDGLEFDTVFEEPVSSLGPDAASGDAQRNVSTIFDSVDDTGAEQWQSEDNADFSAGPTL